MNDQLESLATAEDHHSSCSEWLLDGTRVARSSSLLSFLNFMLGTLPERTWPWQSFPRPINFRFGQIRKLSSAWLSHLGGTSENSSDIFRYSIFRSFEITSRSFEVVRSLVVYLTSPSPCVPLRPPASPGHLNKCEVAAIPPSHGRAPLLQP